MRSEELMALMRDNGARISNDDPVVDVLLSHEAMLQHYERQLIEQIGNSDAQWMAANDRRWERVDASVKQAVDDYSQQIVAATSGVAEKYHAALRHIDAHQVRMQTMQQSQRRATRWVWIGAGVAVMGVMALAGVVSH